MIERYTIAIIYYAIWIVGFIFNIAALLWVAERLITYILKQLKVYPLLWEWAWEYYRKKSELKTKQ